MREIGGTRIETLVEGRRVSSREHAHLIVRAAHARLCARNLEIVEAGEYMTGHSYSQSPIQASLANELFCQEKFRSMS